MSRPTRGQMEEEMYRALASSEDEESDYPSRTYEEGVENALRWATGNTDSKPMGPVA